MELGISGQLFWVGGASSGLGRAVAKLLASEGAQVIASARRGDLLQALSAEYPGRIEPLELDVALPGSEESLLRQIGGRQLHGALVNGGGPPAKSVLEASLADWDLAYAQVLRWKIAFTQALVSQMQPYGYGRMLFLESAAVRQPIENLVLSNSLRMAVVGFVKTLSQELSRSGITFNVIGPGSHDTPAIERLYQKKSEQTGLDPERVRGMAVQQIPVGFLGDADDFAQLAVWMLSPSSRYVTGQVFLVEGGSVRSS